MDRGQRTIRQNLHHLALTRYKILEATIGKARNNICLSLGIVSQLSSLGAVSEWLSLV